MSAHRPLVRLDEATALDVLAPRIGAAHTQETDARLATAVAAFGAEQGQGYGALERSLRAWTQSHLRAGDIRATVELAERIRARFDVFVLVGIGGSDLGARTLHDALDHPFHNQLSREERRGAPEVYFTGDTFDPRRLVALMDMLERRGALARTCLNVVSKSGKTGETISAAMVARDRMVRAGVADWPSHVVATTGLNDQSVLYQMSRRTPFLGMLPVPDGVGGRYSFASPVGLLPFAVSATQESPDARVREALAGYGWAHACGLEAPGEANLAARLARWWHLAERHGGCTELVFCNYADDARLGDWFVQLYEESLQERGEGLNVLSTRGPTGNHSILNGILRGPRDKVVLVADWDDLGPGATIPSGTGIQGELESFEGLGMADVQHASCRATVADYLENGVSTATISCGVRSGACLFALMRVLMDAVALKGRLQGLHVGADDAITPGGDLTYLQHGVEGYKVRTRRNAEEMRAGLS